MPEEINESEFHDVRTSKPQQGQVMARYAATADFVDGPLKRDIIELLQHHDALSAPKIMKKIGCAIEKDSFRIPILMARDLLSGMSSEEVSQKPYRYIMEAFYYTKKEYVPKDDPHWSVISLLNLEEFLDSTGNKVKITTKKVTNENLST